MSAETHISLCGRKVWFAQAQESKHALKWKSKHQPCNRKPLGEIGRLSLINIELNLFQELESAVHWSDGYTMLISLSLLTCWYSYFDDP